MAYAGLLAAAIGSADLRSNCQGTGFVGTSGADHWHRIIMELSVPVVGLVALLHCESAGLFLFYGK